MEIIERQNSLFEKWKIEREGFIADGVVDEEAYLSSKPRVVYLLKEVNGGQDWSLTDYISAGGRAHTWNNIARWQYGLQNLEREIHWDEIKDISNNWRKERLQSICAVNVKKTSGGCTSKKDELVEKAFQDRKFLKEQIEIYNPDIIICCGTSYLYFDYIYGIRAEGKMTNRGIWFIKDKSKVIVSYLHPEARVRDSMLYYGLTDAVKEILSI